MWGWITFIVGPAESLPQAMYKPRIKSEPSGCCISKLPIKSQQKRLEIVHYLWRSLDWKWRGMIMWVARHNEDLRTVIKIIRNIDVVCRLTFVGTFEKDALTQFVVSITMPMCCKMN